MERSSATLPQHVSLKCTSGRPGRGIASCRSAIAGAARQAMLAAQMQKSADKAMAAVSVVITAARPVAVVGKILEHQIEQLHRLCDFDFRHWFDRSRSGQRIQRITGRRNPHRRSSRQNNRLDQARIIVLDVADARADRPADHLFGRVGREQRLELRARRPAPPRARPATSRARGPPASGCEAQRTARSAWW